MALILNGTDGLSDVDGTAATPAIRGTDTNTGIFFPAADTIAFSEGGTESARFDANGNLGIGTASPVARLDVRGILAIANSAASYWGLDRNDSDGAFTIADGTTERMRIDSSGNLLLNTTTATHSGITSKCILKSSNDVLGVVTDSGNTQAVRFTNGTTAVGSINLTTSATSYGTSSDYRLKEDIAPMTGALDKVALLKPVTYKWKVDGSDGQGFIAHELQAVVPDCVTGEKDAVDAEGKPVHQGIDTSFLVATLTAAIQEQQALITQLQADVAALKVQP